MTAINIFNAALYLRLSKEDEDKINISESIKNQKDFLIRYCNENDFNIVDIYIDDGYSGTTFERPNFIRMLSDIENEKINLVITKDLSRLGRDYILTGHYIEKYFPEHLVRYIAVNDGIDTFLENAANDITPFKSVINDMYAKDISKKVRTALDSKKKNGKFIGSFAPFGYKKDIVDKNHLVIDEQASEYVKYIFKLFLEGESINTIAKKLSLLNIPTPSLYKSKTAKNKCLSYEWNAVSVKNILTNSAYIGVLTQGKTKKISYKSKKRVVVKPQQWIISKNTHEPLIAYDDFLQVQNIISKRKYQPKNFENSNLLTGIVFCANCGKPMTITRQGENRIYLICSSWKKQSNLCTSHCISYKIVIAAIIDEINKHITSNMLKEIFEAINNSNNNDIDKEIKILNKNNDMNDQLKLKLYKDNFRGLISESELLSICKLIDEEQLINIEKLNRLNDIINFSNYTVDKIKDVLGSKSLSRSKLIMLVNKVVINCSSEITIEFSFKK